MSSVGQTLREAREARGLTLHDMQEKTKIQPRYLKAIEDDRFNVLPGHFYTRAFVRTYAEHLGVDPQPLLSQLQEPQGHELESVSEMPQLSRRADREREPSFSLAKWFSRGLLILFLILVVSVIYIFVDGANMGVDFFTGKNQEQKDQISPRTSDDPGQDEDQPEAGKNKEEENVEPAVTVKKTGEEGETTSYELSGTDKVVMEVKTNAHVWFEVREGDAGGEVLTSKEVPEDHSEEFTSETGLFIRIGNTRGVELTVNDTEIDTDYARPRNFLFELK